MIRIASISLCPRLLACLALSFAFFASASTEAGTLSLNYTESFGAVPPDGPTPYANSFFDDAGVGVGVTLTMTVAATVVDADVTSVYFNLDPSLDPTLLSFLRVSGSGPIASDTTITTGVDFEMADGDGFYDIFFDLPAPPGNQDTRFNAGEDLVYDITYTGVGSLTASSFNFLATPAGGAGPFLSVVRFQDTGPKQKDSDWIGAVVPEPSTAALMILGVIALLPIARRRIKR